MLCIGFGSCSSTHNVMMCSTSDWTVKSKYKRCLKKCRNVLESISQSWRLHLNLKRQQKFRNFKSELESSSWEATEREQQLSFQELGSLVLIIRVVGTPDNGLPRAHFPETWHYFQPSLPNQHMVWVHNPRVLSRTQTPPERRRSSDIRPIPWASLTLSAFWEEFSIHQSHCRKHNL